MTPEGPVSFNGSVTDTRVWEVLPRAVRPSLSVTGPGLRGPRAQASPPAPPAGRAAACPRGGPAGGGQRERPLRGLVGPWLPEVSPRRHSQASAPAASTHHSDTGHSGFGLHLVATPVTDYLRDCCLHVVPLFRPTGPAPPAKTDLTTGLAFGRGLPGTWESQPPSKDLLKLSRLSKLRPR